MMVFHWLHEQAKFFFHRCIMAVLLCGHKCVECYGDFRYCLVRCYCILSFVIKITQSRSMTVDATSMCV
jgi:hypothetical protein